LKALQRKGGLSKGRTAGKVEVKGITKARFGKPRHPQQKKEALRREAYGGKIEDVKQGDRI